MTQQALVNKDGAYVCRVCGSKTHDPNIAYCSAEHAEAAGEDQLVSSAVLGFNNTDNPQGDPSVGDEDQFLHSRQVEHAKEMLAGAEESNQAGQDEAYTVVDPATGHTVGKASAEGTTQAVDNREDTEDTGGTASAEKPRSEFRKDDWLALRRSQGYTDEELTNEDGKALTVDELRELDDR